MIRTELIMVQGNLFMITRMVHGSDWRLASTTVDEDENRGGELEGEEGPTTVAIKYRSIDTKRIT